MGTVIVIASGKGGTGKTTVSAAIASCLAFSGKKTLCMDCDVGLKNLDIVLGLTDIAPFDFFDVQNGSAALADAAAAHPDIENLYFLSAPSLMSPEDIDEDDMKNMMNEIRQEFDCCIIDAPAGIGAGFRLAASVADIAVVTATGDPASLRDGQRTVMELKRLGIENVRLLLNRVSSKMMRHTKQTVDDVIDAVGAQLIGIISEDRSVPLAEAAGIPLMLFGAKYAYDQFLHVAKRLSGENVPIGKV